MLKKVDYKVHFLFFWCDMKFKKNIEEINKNLIDIYSCKDIDNFYVLTTKLYYRINRIVFNIESDILNIEKE